MKKTSIFLLFFIFQIALLWYVGASSSAKDVRFVFVMGEALLCCTTMLFYARLPRTIPQKVSVVPFKEEEQDEGMIEKNEELEQERKQFQEALKEQKAVIENLQKTVLQREEEKDACSALVSQYAVQIEEISSEVAFQKTAFFSLAGEIEKLFCQLDTERKTHAIEIRALLGKEGKSEKKSHKEEMRIPSSLSPLSVALILLSKHQEGTILFESIKKCSQIPSAIVSLSKKHESYISEKFSSLGDVSQLESLCAEKRTQLEKLPFLEPYQFFYDKNSCIAFRICLKDVEDSILIVPM